MLNITIQDLDRFNFEEVALKVIGHVENGEISALDAQLLSNYLKKLSETLKQETLDTAIAEGEQLTPDERIHRGYSYQIKSTATTYDFSQDNEFNRLYSLLSERKSLMKQSNILKTKNNTLLITEDGEEIPAAKVKKPAGTTISISSTKKQ